MLRLFMNLSRKYLDSLIDSILKNFIFVSNKPCLKLTNTKDPLTKKFLKKQDYKSSIESSILDKVWKKLPQIWTSMFLLAKLSLKFTRTKEELEKNKKEIKFIMSSKLLVLSLLTMEKLSKLEISKLMNLKLVVKKEKILIKFLKKMPKKRLRKCLRKLLKKKRKRTKKKMMRCNNRWCSTCGCKMDLLNTIPKSTTINHFRHQRQWWREKKIG